MHTFMRSIVNLNLKNNVIDLKVSLRVIFETTDYSRHMQQISINGTKGQFFN